MTTRIESSAAKAKMNDVLLEIGVRLDDETLLKLSRVPFWRAHIVRLIATRTSDFWYRKTCHITRVDLRDRPEADWKNIYYHVKAQQIECELPVHVIPWCMFTSIKFDRLGDLNLFQVMEEIYGKPRWTGFGFHNNQAKVWYWVSDPQVLSYVISAGYLLVCDEAVKTAIRSAQSNHPDMIPHLTQLLSSQSS